MALTMQMIEGHSRMEDPLAWLDIDQSSTILPLDFENFGIFNAKEEHDSGPATETFPSISIGMELCQALKDWGTVPDVDANSISSTFPSDMSNEFSQVLWNDIFINQSIDTQSKSQSSSPRKRRNENDDEDDLESLFESEPSRSPSNKKARSVTPPQSCTGSPTKASRTPTKDFSLSDFFASVAIDATADTKRRTVPYPKPSKNSNSSGKHDSSQKKRTSKQIKESLCFTF